MTSCHILVTTDFSPESERPFGPVAELAARLDARVTLLHVVEDLPVIPHGAPLAGLQPALDAPARSAAARQRLATIAKQFPAGLRVDRVVEIGTDIPGTVVGYAERHAVDLIAIASHGRSGLRRLLLGSTAEQILRHASRPVLVYPPPASKAPA